MALPAKRSSVSFSPSNARGLLARIHSAYQGCAFYRVTREIRNLKQEILRFLLPSPLRGRVGGGVLSAPTPLPRPLSAKRGEGRKHIRISVSPSLRYHPAFAHSGEPRHASVLWLVAACIRP